MRVALLARVSSEDQAAADRHSLPAQLGAMRARCEREGWDVVREFVAPGESAFTGDLAKRPALLEAVEMAEAGGFDVLMVHESSRFARSAKLHHEVEARLARAGVRWLEADEPMLAATPETFVAGGVKAVLNEYWSRKMSQHIRKGLRQRFEMGLPVGDIPFGYVAKGSEVPVVVEEEASALRMAFRLRSAGAGYVEIAREMNVLGMRPRSKVGRTTFTESAVQSLLENEFYAGVVKYRGERAPGAHVAIVDEDTWLAAQAVVNRMGMTRRRNPRLLSGLAECVICGARLNISQSGSKVRRFEYYRESRRGACGSRRWLAEAVEAMVDEMVVAMVTDQEWIDSLERRARKVPAKDTGERTRLVEERKRATRAWVAGDLDEAEYRLVKDAIDARLERVPSGLPGGVLFGSKQFKTLADVWAVQSLERKRAALRVMWERVYVDLEARRVWFRPRREFEAVFKDRRGWVHGTPDRSQGRGVPTDRPWLIEVAEMVA